MILASDNISQAVRMSTFERDGVTISSEDFAGA